MELKLLASHLQGALRSTVLQIMLLSLALGPGADLKFELPPQLRHWAVQILVEKIDNAAATDGLPDDLHDPLTSSRRVPQQLANDE